MNKDSTWLAIGCGIGALIALAWHLIGQTSYPPIMFPVGPSTRIQGYAVQAGDYVAIITNGNLLTISSTATGAVTAGRVTAGAGLGFNTNPANVYNLWMTNHSADFLTSGTVATGRLAGHLPNWSIVPTNGFDSRYPMASENLSNWSTLNTNIGAQYIQKSVGDVGSPSLYSYIRISGLAPYSALLGSTTITNSFILQTSEDGRTFKPLNSAEIAVPGITNGAYAPTICYWSNRWIVMLDSYAFRTNKMHICISSNLLDWTQYSVTNSPATNWVWGGEFLVTSIPYLYYSANFQIWVTTPTDLTLSDWNTASLLLGRTNGWQYSDPSVTVSNTTYYLTCRVQKDTLDALCTFTNNSPTGPFVMAWTNTSLGAGLEGPCYVKDEDKWKLYWQTDLSNNVAQWFSESTDLKTWSTPVETFSLGNAVSHSSVFRTTNVQQKLNMINNRLNYMEPGITELNFTFTTTNDWTTNVYYYRPQHGTTLLEVSAVANTDDNSDINIYGASYYRKVCYVLNRNTLQLSYKGTPYKYDLEDPAHDWDLIVTNQANDVAVKLVGEDPAGGVGAIKWHVNIKAQNSKLIQ